jgi:glycosyltransferase involved in cell wall biosynthesis
MIEKDTVVVIPALNEESSINLVLGDIPKQRVLEVIVVDNGSTDLTAKRAREAGALVISESQKGYGKACLTGIKKAASYSPKFIIFLDGDYSDDPKEMQLLWNQLDAGQDLVIGSRLLGKAEPGAMLPQALFGNWLATFLTKIFFGGKRFSDLGPFRGISWKALEKIKMQDTNFGWTMEMQIKAITHNLRYSEVSMSYKSRIGTSKISGTVLGSIKAGYKILYTILRYRFLR